MMIEFGVQCSKGKGSDLISLVHPFLNKIFLKDETMQIESDDLDYFSIIFRVAGEFNNFDNGDGCERIKKVRGEKCITMDYVIPQHKWEKMDEDEFKIYIAEAVKECFIELKKKAKSLKWEFNEEKLDAGFTRGIDVFIGS
jgi:hypothetical protein